MRNESLTAATEQPRLDEWLNAATEQPRLDLKTLTAVIVTILSWGSAYAGIRAALVAYSPAHVALLRYGTSSVALAVYAVLTGMKLPALKDVPGLAGIGLLGIAFYNVALSYGQTVVPAATASFLTFAGVAVIAVGRSGRLPGSAPSACCRSAPGSHRPLPQRQPLPRFRSCTSGWSQVRLAT